MLFVSLRLFAQSDTTIIYNTPKIFSITIRDTNKSIFSMADETQYKEVYIDTLTRKYIVFERKYTNSHNPLISRKTEKVFLQNIVEIGYKNGTHEENAAIAGAVTFAIAGVIIGNVAKNQRELYNDKTKTVSPFLAGVIGLAMGAGVGYFIGGLIDKYEYLDLTNYGNERKFTEITRIINRGIKRNK